MDGTISQSDIRAELLAYFHQEEIQPSDLTVDELQRLWNVSENEARRRAMQIVKEQPQQWAWIIVTDGRRDRRVLRRLGNDHGSDALAT